MMLQTHSRNRLEACLSRALSKLGEGWDLDVIEAMVDQYNIDFSRESESTISEIECALRDLLGSGANLFIDRFYDELKKSGIKL
jgi:hypothetical protein